MGDLSGGRACGAVRCVQSGPVLWTRYRHGKRWHHETALVSPQVQYHGALHVQWLKESDDLSHHHGSAEDESRNPACPIPHIVPGQRKTNEHI